MKFTKVDVLPKPTNKWHNLQIFLAEFITSNGKYASIHYNPEEYKNITSASSSLRGAIKKSGEPIKVRVINDVIYIIRTDI